MNTRSWTTRMTAGVAGAALVIMGAGLAAPAWAEPQAPPAASQGVPAKAGGGALANTAHLDFLLDEVSPPELPAHSTYRLAEEPELLLPWTYADARDGGAFERIGGGPLDAATGDYAQGAFNSDDVSRAAVVYLRHWQQTGDDASRQKAYDVLRALAYFQTTEGEDAGNVVLWMQTDGELNPSAEPVELPDPSDSEESYWLARTIWALGEGYAAFRDADPEFAAFLQERLQLSVAAVDREVLVRYGEYAQADGAEVPAWLIVNGADATAEALLGLSAYVQAAPDDAAVRSATEKLAEGVAAYARLTTGGHGGVEDGKRSWNVPGADAASSWPYGAILPWAESRSMWHAWSSQMGGALARASVALGDEGLRQPAVTEAVRFAPTLLAAGGPENAWYPSPTERVQIAYGADSRIQNLLATADAADLPGLVDLAGVQAAWFFGLNPAAEPMYDPATGVTFDGIQADGSINRNSGAESAIHGLLSMLALDAHPEAAAFAQSLTVLDGRNGLRVVEAEDAVSTDGTVVTPESSWTEESSWSGDYLELTPGQTATFDLAADAGDPAGMSTAGTSTVGTASVGTASAGTASAGTASADTASATTSAGRRLGGLIVEPVLWQVEKGTAEAPKSVWRSGRLPLGTLTSTVGEQGLTAASGALLPQRLPVPVVGSRTTAEVEVRAGTVQLDALLVRPAISTLRASSEAGGSAELAQNALPLPLPATMGTAGAGQTVRSYDASGALVEERTVDGPTTVWLRPGGYALALG